MMTISLIETCKMMKIKKVSLSDYENIRIMKLMLKLARDAATLCGSVAPLLNTTIEADRNQFMHIRP